MRTWPDIADCWQTHLRTRRALEAFRREAFGAIPGAELYGITPEELEGLFDAMRAEADVVTVFSLFAACEATIRVSSRAMAEGLSGGAEAVALRTLYAAFAAKRHAPGPPVVGKNAKQTIVGVWLKARAKSARTHKNLNGLALVRHWIAHRRHFGQPGTHAIEADLAWVSVSMALRELGLVVPARPLSVRV